MNPSENSRAGSAFWLLAALAVGLTAVSAGSLWVDEALTANEVSQATVGAMWKILWHERGSDLQMPLYLFHLWAWVKVFGTSEWALRAINIPWLMLAVSTCLAALGGRRRASLLLVLFASPFAWYYLNEARPYAVQIAASVICGASMARLTQADGLSPSHERRWLMIFNFGLVALSASSLLGMIWAGGFFLAAGACLTWRRLLKLSFEHGGTQILSFGILALVGAYYCATLKAGARATGGTTDLRNLGFIAYELLGFGGLGPGRLEIRSGALNAFRSYVLPLVLYGTLLGVVGVAGLRAIWQRHPKMRLAGAALAVALPSAVLVAAGYRLQFRILERHFAPLFVVVLWVLAAGSSEWWGRGHWRRLGAGAFFALAMWSCLETRFATRHRKDDYRDAAAAADLALREGKTVWWNADWHGAVYYRLPLGTNSGGPREALWVLNTSPAALAALPSPDLVIASKPDLFDQKGAINDYLRKGPYQRVETLPAFELWTRTAPASGRN